MEGFSVRYIVDDVEAAIPFYTDALDSYGATLRDGMGSSQGWPLILAELRRAAARRAESSGGAPRAR